MVDSSQVTLRILWSQFVYPFKSLESLTCAASYDNNVMMCGLMCQYCSTSGRHICACRVLVVIRVIDRVAHRFDITLTVHILDLLIEETC